MRKLVLKNTALFICGPTAVGKTSVAIALAKHFNTEIISFDSRQFYKELKIGAAPPSRDELNAVPHHFIHNLSVSDKPLNAGAFEKQALKTLTELFKKHKIVVLVGGSGLYMKALTEGFDTLPKISLETRNTLIKELETKGLETLSKELIEKDKEYAQRVDLQNPQRVMRALEIIRETGKPFSHFRQNEKAIRPFESINIGLELPRPELYARINKRVELMDAEGLEKEAFSLKAYHENNALQTVGYKEWWPYFNGLASRDFTIEEIKKNSRRYAKRQLTWFKNQTEAKWFLPTELTEIKAYLAQQI